MAERTGVGVPRASQDAVVIIPGIMGSSLAIGDRKVWGFEKLGWYARSWMGNALDDLHLTEDELAGTYGRVRATGLLKLPAFAPFLNGLEPYTSLTRAVRSTVWDDAAVMEFPYDWRLPVRYNATLLAEAADRHLETWRQHPAYEAGRKQRPALPPPRLVLIAHSMGGLLVQQLPAELDVRAVVTLGTPFDGSIKAMEMLGEGKGSPVPFPRKKLRVLARTLPGLYDLLPTFRCLHRDDKTDPGRLRPSDVVAVGGKGELATTALPQQPRPDIKLPWPHTALVGTSQPTASSLSLKDGQVSTYEHTYSIVNGAFERDAQECLVRPWEGGDGTVPRNSARPPPIGSPYSVLPQQHGPLAKTPEALEVVRHVILDIDEGIYRLGGGELGLRVPDVVLAGKRWSVSVTGADSPLDVRIEISGEDGSLIDVPVVRREDNALIAHVAELGEGIVTVRLDGGGASAVTQRVLVADGRTRE